MYRVKIYFFVLIVIKFHFVIKSEGYGVNSSRKERSFSDSFETQDFSNDRYIPRFYLNRTKNRFSHFQSEFYNTNKTSDSKIDRVYEPESSSIRPLAWHDFPQLINNKLTTANRYTDPSSVPANVLNHEVNTSVLSNYSQIIPKFPIYFTNPSTGVVYAITEVAKPNVKSENHTTSGILSAGTTKSYGDGKYTLQCTMVDALTRPTKKTLISTNHPALGTKIPALKKKKSKKNSGKRRTTAAVQVPQLSATNGFNANIVDNIHKQAQNVTRLVPKITKFQRPSITLAPHNSVFSNKRKVIKRMVPPTVPTNIFSPSATTSKPKPVKDENEDNDSDEFFYGESYFDNSLSGEKKQKRIKRHEHSSEGVSNINNINASKAEDDDSSSEEDEDFDYMTQMMSPLQDVFETLSQRAVGILISKKEEETEDSDKPHYTIFGADSSKDNSSNHDNSWFGSWFYNSQQKTKNDEITTTTTSPPKISGWFDYWYDEYDDNGKTATTETPQDKDQMGSRWFFNWFGGNSDTTTKKSTSITTTTTTQAPFLSFINPIKNTSDWFGILANNLMNKTLSQKSTNPPHLDGANQHKVTYDGYQIWRLHLKSQSDLKTMERYKHTGEGAKLQWLKGPSIRGPTDIIVSTKLATDFQGTLNYENIHRDVMIFDLRKAINYDSVPKTVMDIYQKTNRFPITWTKYYGYEDVIRFLEYMQMRHPHLVELIHIGRTYEGRPLVITKITNKNRNRNIKQKNKKHRKENKEVKEVFIEAGAHGREWIGPAAATWIIKELVKIFRSNSTTNETIRNSTWYILPVLNPDGYEYAHEFDRFWRKSRSKHISKPSGIIDSAMAWIQQDKHEKVCYGVDLNRNWDYEWGNKDSSKSPCNEFYAGPNAFSEPETRALSNFLMNKRKNIKLFVSLHAYGQVISYPNNVTTALGAQKVDDLMEVAMMGVENLRMSGSTAKYKINVGNDMKAVQSGTSDCYAAYGVGIPFSYTIDLSDDGVHGFLLPGSFIEGTSRDAFEMIKGMLDYI